MDKITMGARFKQARLNKHLTQEALGELCDCGTTYISDIERGAKLPKRQAITTHPLTPMKQVLLPQIR